MIDRPVSYKKADRREWSRYKIAGSIIVRGKDEDGTSFQESGALKDISVNGALGNLTRPLCVGTKLEILINMPPAKASWMKYDALVIRAERTSSGSTIALRFDKTRPQFTAAA